MLESFETASVRMERILLVTVQVPEADSERVLAAVMAVTPLRLGNYDSNSFETSAGFERYRPREGAVAGVEGIVRKRPGVSEIKFQLAADQGVLSQVVEAVFQAHSYQEPVILVEAALASRSKGLDDSANPNRWWNTTGDWKKPA